MPSGRLGLAMREVAGIAGISRGPLAAGATGSRWTPGSPLPMTPGSRARYCEALDAVRGKAG